MITSASIKIVDRNFSIHLYHHGNGYPDYPEGVGSVLKEYLLSHYSISGESIANNLVKGKVSYDDGYEITSCIHGNENYLYVIDCYNQTLKCYKHGWGELESECINPKNEVEIP